MRKVYKKIFGVFCAVLVTLATTNVQALSTTTDDTADALVSNILGDGVTATGAVKTGTVYTFSDGASFFGIDKGIVLDTSGKVENEEQDEDLKKLIDADSATTGATYGGHTSSLEFEMTASGTLLNFNYVFASSEFKCNVEYNDVFGLFVSVNGGEYENIALITRNDGTQVPVNLTNLRAGLSGTEMGNGLTPLGSATDTTHSLFNVLSEEQLTELKDTVFNKSYEHEGKVYYENIDASSIVFNAKKTVKVGDKVKVKLVIADASDEAYDSFVMVQANSLSFHAAADYSSDKIEGLNSKTTYKVTSGTNVYTITADDSGNFKLVGTDDNGKAYDFHCSVINIKNDSTNLNLTINNTKGTTCASYNKSSNPKTFDGIYTYYILGGVSILAVGALLVLRKKIN